MYMLTPLHTHIDFGFGATGNAFRESADKLERSLAERAGVFNEHLPINYLRRHAIELFLKSAIVIIHRRLAIPYGASPATGEPYAFVNGQWIPFTRLHSVKRLWGYLKVLFLQQKAALDKIKAVNWGLTPDVDNWIDTIESLDPRSTFFRYPNCGESQTDAPKAVMAEAAEEDILDDMKQDPEKKQFILLVENDEREVTRSYYYSGPALTEFSRLLKEAADHFCGLHNSAPNRDMSRRVTSRSRISNRELR